ncbi:DUF4214 domain-containing protein [Leptolyngbya sp. AN03gr2]|uniref:DUF4214 domain-containing protein n=1 Tax=Leptolyngbya sp. AN03gr2 TaxID=3423364 RepID=UPI003D319908
MTAYQFASDLYSKVLGRAPDAFGWTGIQSWVERDSSIPSLRALGSRFFQSEEFGSKNYTAEQKLSVLYRVALNREADIWGMSYWKSQIETGARTFNQVAADFFWVEEFNAKAPRYAQTKYDFDSPQGSVYKMSANSPGFVGNGFQLQQLIDSSAPFSTIYLAQGTTIQIDRAIELKNGISLMTWGNPSTYDYVKQARLYRSATYNDGTLIGLQAGSTLSHVWIDGQRNNLNNTNWKLSNINVATYGGNGAVVEWNRIDNTLGWTSLMVGGEIHGLPPSEQLKVQYNFVDTTTSSHRKVGNRSTWSDGISNYARRAEIVGNVVLNATDVGIISFATPNTLQHSGIANNFVINTVNSAYGGLASDGLSRNQIPLTSNFRRSDASGLTFQANTLWNSNATHFDIGISLGTRAWFGTLSHTINGSFLVHNTSAGMPLRVGVGIVVSGAVNVGIGANTFNWVFDSSQVRDVPKAPLVASMSSGHASLLWSDLAPIDRLVSGVISPEK